jgi:hypothetical protein
VDEEVAVPSFCPGGYGQQSVAALFYRDQHVVPAQGVKGVLPVHLQGHAAGVGGHASADGMPNHLVASRNANRHVAAPGCSQCGVMRPGHTALQADTILPRLQ